MIDWEWNVEVMVERNQELEMRMINSGRNLWDDEREELRNHRRHHMNSKIPCDGSDHVEDGLRMRFERRSLQKTWCLFFGREFVPCSKCIIIV